MKKEVLISFLVFALILNYGVINALRMGDVSHSINEVYPPSDFIKGWMNISANNDNANLRFTTNFGDSISLLNLVRLNDMSPTCVPTSCETGYVSVVNSQSKEKVFSLNPGEEKVFGFKIMGRKLNYIINSTFSLKINSDASESISPQIYIDILDDDSFDWKPYKSTLNFLEKSYGCYNSAHHQGYAYLIPKDSIYCERITLPITPNMRIGANVRGSGNVQFEMRIRTVDGTNKSGKCIINANSGGEISCIPKYSDGRSFDVDKLEHFFVCIEAISGTAYEISYESSYPCGYSGNYFEGDYSADYEIFAQPGEYDSIGEFTLNNTERDNSVGKKPNNIETEIYNYLSQKYLNEDIISCEPECIIPIRFWGTSQQVRISDFRLFINTDIGSLDISDIHEIQSVPAKVSFDFQKIYLDKANFSVPEEIKEHNLRLSFNEAELFSEKISVKKMFKILSVSPRTIMAAYPVSFKVILEEPPEGESLTYTWDFGDGNKKTTTIDSVEHTYTSMGNFILTITAKGSISTASKSFDILVEKPELAIEILLNEKKNNLENVKSYVNTLQPFYRDSLKNALNLTNLENDLKTIEQKNNNAQSDGEYIEILSNLFELTIPREVFESASADAITFFPENRNIEPGIVQEIGGGNYNPLQKETYANSILRWQHENMDAKISFTEFSEVHEDFEKPIIRVFRLDIEKRTSSETSPYLIIGMIKNLRFMQDYSERRVGEYYYISLDSFKNTIVFSTTESVDFATLPAFISPSINELSLIEFEEEEKKSIIGILVVSISGLLVFAFIVYIVLYNWYNKKYENYLFKNKNDLYNIVSYVHSLKNMEIDNTEISKKLAKSGWKQEQITYVMKKYVGKRTGMFGFSFRKPFGTREKGPQNHNPDKNYKLNH